MGELVDVVDFPASFIFVVCICGSLVRVGIKETRRELRFGCNDGEVVAQHIMHGGGIGLALVRSV